MRPEGAERRRGQDIRERRGTESGGQCRRRTESVVNVALCTFPRFWWLAELANLESCACSAGAQLVVIVDAVAMGDEDRSVVLRHRYFSHWGCCKASSSHCH